MSMASLSTLRGGAGMVVCTALAMSAVGRPAAGAISATATVSTAQTSSPYTYTATVHNTGNTTIGTFWFAWTLTPREYNFLPAVPGNVVSPAGWVAPISHGATPGDEYGIEWFNQTGAAIAPGGIGTFMFTSTDSPATLAGPAWFPGFNVTHSVVYIGAPEGDPGYAFDVAVTPAPGGAVMGLGLGLAGLAIRRRQR
jgi:hypothetical protein